MDQKASTRTPTNSTPLVFVSQPRRISWIVTQRVIADWHVKKLYNDEGGKNSHTWANVSELSLAFPSYIRIIAPRTAVIKTDHRPFENQTKQYARRAVAKGKAGSQAS